MNWSQIVAGVIFLITLGLIFTEKINRVMAAMIGASAMVLVGIVFGFYAPDQALKTIDLETIGLLLGMMILVTLLEPTGAFEYLALTASKVSRGKPIYLLFLMGTITTVISMFLNNVTTIVLIGPVSVLICEILGISAVPYLITEALLSNIGGVATLIGDPPNMLIASAAGFSFDTFLTHALPVVVVAWLGCNGLVYFLFKKELRVRPQKIDVIEHINAGEALHDRKAMLRVLIVLGAAIFLFLVQDTLRLSPAFIALGTASIALVWVHPDLEDTLKRIDWSVLFFFAALFILVGGLDASGLLSSISHVLASLNGIHAKLFGLLLIWAVAGLSAIVDNIPITVAFIPIIKGMAGTGVALDLYWWAMVFGAGFGANATIIGATANMMSASISEKTHTPITSKIWIQKGLPVMLFTTLLASLLYLIFF